MAIKLVVKANGKELWLSFDSKTAICLNNIADMRGGIVKSGMLDSISKYLEIHKMARDFDMLCPDGVVYSDHPIFKLSTEKDDLEELVLSLQRRIIELKE